ncbi:MAG: hypothetical protein ABFC31_07845 [Clostridiaceae bacterium]
MASDSSSTNKSVLNRILPFLIIIFVFLVLGCISAYFLNNSVLENTNQGSESLWQIIFIVSFLIVILTGLSLLISYSSRKKKEDEAAAIKAYTIDLKNSLVDEYGDGDDVFYCLPKQLEPASSSSDSFSQYIRKIVAQTSNVKRLRIAPDNGNTEAKKCYTNVMALMIDNLGKMKEYYDWSKDQAVIVFGVAVGACIVGTLIVVAAFILPIVMKLSFETALLTAIGGLITDVFAGTTLLVYRSSISQLNRYHDCMHEDQRFLCAVNLLNKFTSTKKRDDTIIEIIQNQLKINLACARDDDEEVEVTPTPAVTEAQTAADQTTNLINNKTN